MRQISGTNKSNQEIIRLLDEDSELTDCSDIVNKFADFFNSIGNDLDLNLPTSTLSPLNSIDYNPRTFYIFPVTLMECEQIISKLKITKSPVNYLPAKMFKSIKSLVSYPLSKIINSSFISGIFPQQLKIARITPIFKNGLKTNPSNYRPISSLPYISKIFERCMTTRLT